MKNKNFISKYLPNEIIGVVSMKLLSIIFLCSYSYVNAQPLWEGLSVDKFYREKGKRKSWTITRDEYLSL